MNLSFLNKYPELKIHGLIFFSIIVLIRLAAMWLVPLTDTTEARYGEIARKMVETGDWITLWHDYGTPFWAKPPLSTWLSALSMKLFGINEFAARLPALLLAVAILLLMWHFARSWLEKSTQWLAIIIISSMSLFYLASGTVMTDMSLLFTCTLALVAFWFAVTESERKWGYLFFAALGLGLLAKGPAAVILSLLPIFFWLLWTNSWKRMWISLPWSGGILLMLAISLPWYIMAEIKTPGFLNYFIVGEHINRFLVPSWQGDLYGNAHHETLGTIWLFLLVDTLPWMLIIIPWLIFSKIKKTSTVQLLNPGDLDHQEKYLWCWLLAPLLFFTFSHNIIPTYTLTALPAMGILMAQWLDQIAIKNGEIRKWVYGAGLFSPTILVLLLIATQIDPEVGKKSAREISHLFQTITQSAPDPGTHSLSYVGNRLNSMDFYNAGKAVHFDSVDQALESLQPHNPLYLALTNHQVQQLSKNQANQIKFIAATKRYQLYKAIAGNNP